MLRPEEITSLLRRLPEPLRTAVELDAFTGLRRGELIGLEWLAAKDEGVIDAEYVEVDEGKDTAT